MSFDASSPTQQIFQQIEQELGLGMIPQIFRILENQPLLLYHLWGQFRAVILQGQLPRTLKEMIALIVATATNCEYIKAVHLSSLTLQGVNPAELEALLQGLYEAESFSTATRNTIRFATLATATRSAADTDEWQELKQQTTALLEAIGLEPEEKVELVATVALFEELCALANLLDLDPNQP